MKIKHTMGIILAGVLIAVAAGCGKQDTPATRNLTFLSATPLNIPETSGLAEYPQDRFLTVSDSLSRVFVLGKDGTVQKMLEYTGKNLEGVVYDFAGNVIYVVEENSNEIVRLDTFGIEQGRFTVPLQNADPRHGLEGISINPANGHLYVISEMNPSLLFEMKTDGTILQTHTLSFASDYSSVFYDQYDEALWILSDDSKTLTKTDLEGKPLITYNTVIKKGEGVVVDSEGSRVYVVTDSHSYFYVLSF